MKKYALRNPFIRKPEEPSPEFTLGDYQKQIDKAVMSGENKVVLLPGTYRCGPCDAVIPKNFTIDGNKFKAQFVGPFDFRSHR